MYLSGVNLGGISEWKGWGPGGFSQSVADARWVEIGQSLPAPIVPAQMIGLHVLPSRGARLLGTTPKGGIVKFTKAQQKENNDFLNFWGKVAADPYRKQSTISKVAEGILQVASVALPAFGYAQAATDAANAGLAISKQNSGTDEKLAIAVMTPAIDKFVADEQKTAEVLNAQKNEALAMQIRALNIPSAPLPFAPPSPSSSTAQIQFPTTVTNRATQKYFGLSAVEVTALAAGLLGVIFWSRK